MSSITNEEQYKTVTERNRAFSKFCLNRSCTSCEMQRLSSDGYIGSCVFKWLALPYKEEELMPCPECNSKCEPMKSSVGDFFVGCSGCYYRIGGKKTEAEAIAAHNRVCRAVEAAKKDKSEKGNVIQ